MPDGPNQGWVMRLVRPWTFVAKQMGGIRIDFGQGAHQRQLTLTFNFLSGIVGLLFLLTAIWSVAAGFLQSARLIPIFPSLFGDQGAAWNWWHWLVLVVSVPVYTIKAFAIAMLVFLAAASLGAIIGFLFGVPRPISESGPPAATQSARPPTPVPTPAAGPPAPPQSAMGGTAANSSGSPGWQANTNLTQISDWLTKIIVGVGLVESYKIAAVARTLDEYISLHFFEGYIGTALVMPALMLAGLIFGFMYSYLFTQLFLATLMARSAFEVSIASIVEQQPDDARVLNKLSPGDPVLAPAISVISEKQPSRGPQLPTAEQRAAAQRILEFPLDDLEDAGSVLLWARAQALLDQYGRAAVGYGKLLRMRRTPEILNEAARVFASARDEDYARTLIDEAVALRDQAGPASRARIVYDAANMALYDDPPGGYTRALTLIDEDVLKYDTNGALYILRACAKGQQYTNERSFVSEAEATRRRRSILDDLQAAKAKDLKRNQEWISYLLTAGNRGAATAPRSDEDRDDDLQSFADDPEFKALVAPPEPKPAD